MAHKQYANLAHLDEFPFDLDYTGVLLKGWMSPVCLFPVVYGAFSIMTAGWPKSWIAVWALFNFAVIHPMDFFVGTLGIGPQYLLDEYAVLDSRYWVVRDTTVTIVSTLEFIVMGPLCYFWYKAINNNSWNAPFFGSMASTWHMIGTLFYFFGELYEGCTHLPAHDCQWPPTFSGYIRLKYFWFIFVGLNWIWIVLPMFVIVWSYYEFQAQAQPNTAKPQPNTAKPQSKTAQTQSKPTQPKHQSQPIKTQSNQVRNRSKPIKS